MNSYPKFIPYRNKRILDLAKDQACTHCGKNDGSVVACHSNLQSDGKGVGKKSDDMFVMYACSECHDNYDQKRVGGGTTKYYKLSQEDFDRAMKKTMKLWIPILLPTEKK